MAPSRDERSRSSSGKTEEDPELSEERQTHQAGRSAIHLAAQQSAQSLREAARPSVRSQPNPWNSTPDLFVRHQRSRQLLSHGTPYPESPYPRQDAEPGTRRVSIHSPTVSSPLNPTPPSSGSEGVHSRRSSADSAEGLLTHNGRPEYRNNRYLTVPSRSDLARRPSRPSLVIPAHDPHPLSQLSSPSSVSTLSSPRSVRDLGSDYTRYYNPFVTPQSSHDELSRRSSIHHPADGDLAGADAAELSKRLSDPFGDHKRISNPFESVGERMRPATPHGPDTCPIHEMHPAVVAIAEPQRTQTPVFLHPADPQKLAFFQYMDDRLGAPECSFPLITDEKEDDDDMHMPQWDDDIRLKPKLRDHFTRENIVNYPGVVDPGPPQPDPWNHVNDRLYPLLQNVRHGLIDPDTPDDALRRTGINGDTLELVFSDEFNKPNRTFYHGDDPYWFGFEGWYGATQDLEWYDPDAIDTGGGTLLLQMDKFINHNLDFRSGMLNSWNQLCFKGGVFEVSMSVPGPAGKHGLWPGVWTMGNLGRPGYLATTDGLWPYTYDECDSGITPNQSVTDGLSYLPGQRLASCTCAGEDHPNPGRGRGAPEIDIAEVSADWGSMGVGVATQSFQVAPFDLWWYPNYDFMENPNRHVSLVNSYTGGPFQQAVSTTSMLNNHWYDGRQYQKFAFEYVPGGTESSFIAWTIGDDEMMKFDARAIGPNGNIGQRLISEEPMSLILNLGISNSWTYVEMDELRFPAVLRVDYVRLYQKPGQKSVTCDPPGYQTTEYIRQHPVAYNNPNLTRWDQTGYGWPKNEFMHGCSV
ncbi:beta-glucan synthesis-associated protein [Saxophila tyrrhenica]|uniref:Beta-glucan synthesis-associated protein n=1 Tax=Saxophila tyrrhenica TaxID=1690608 RepID=A0AAV9PPZ0_9PEZI|nr:beta-glucan synthesis-associated protein [Saxophila tyrrhenica]